MQRRITSFQRFVASSLLTVISACSGPMLDGPKPGDNKPELTMSSSRNPSSVNLSCKSARLEEGTVLLDVVGTYPSKPFYDERLTVDLSQAGVRGKKPLDFACNGNHELILVTMDSIDFVKLHATAGKLIVIPEPILGIHYTDVVEYSSYSKVIAAGILQDPLLAWDKTPVVTITNTGVLQVGLYSMHTFETGEHDRFLYDLRLNQTLPPEQRWPKEGVERAVVSMLDPKNVCVVPLGEAGQSLQYLYIIHYTGNKYGDLADVLVLTLMPKSRFPDLKNITSALPPKFNPAEGKNAHVVIEYETDDGKDAVAAILLPDLKKVFGDE